MNILENTIRTNKPNLSNSSIKQYITCLKSIFYNVYPKSTKINESNIDIFNNETILYDIIKSINNYQTAKTYISAIFCINNDMPRLKELQQIYLQQQQQDNDNQIKTDKQVEKWMSINDINDIYNNVYKSRKTLLKKSILDFNEYTKIQDLLILSLYTQNNGIIRRNSDFVNMKKRNFNKNIDNYIDFKNKTFNFNIYKTAKNYGLQTIPISKSLMRLIKQVIQYNNYDYLIIKNFNGDITDSNYIKNVLTKYLNLSSSMLRHIYISEDPNNNINLNKLIDDSANFSHTPITHLQYIKR